MTEQEKLQLELELLELEEAEALAGRSAGQPESRPGQAALEGFGQTATMGYLPQLQALAEEPMNQVMNAVTGRWSPEEQVHSDGYVQSRDENLRRQRELAESNPAATMAGKAAGIGATMLVPGAAPTSLARAAGQGAAMGAAYNPGDVEGEVDPLQAWLRGRNAVGGAVGGAAGFGAAKGLEMVGDRAMQFAVGRKKYTPGVGTELADQGIWGTKGMMRSQANRKSDEAWKNMERAADGIEGTINNRQIAQEVFKDATAPLTGGGLVKPSMRDVPLVHKSRAFAEDIAGRGAEKGRQVLAHRAAAGNSAFSKTSDQALQNHMAKLSKIEQIKLSQALKQADPSGKMAAADSAYGALARAKKSLNQEETISGFGDLIGTTAKHLAAPVASTVGQLATKGGRAVNASTPMTLEMFLEGLRKK